MSIYFGCDAHKRYSVFGSMNEQGKTGRPVRVEHTRAMFREFLRGLPPGSPIAIESVPAETTLTLARPDDVKVELTPDPGGTVRFAATHRVGVYTVEAPGGPRRLYAVNLLDAEESRIEPQDQIKFSGVTIAAQDQMVQRANVPLWPMLVLAALVLVCLEWLAYNLRVRI